LDADFLYFHELYVQKADEFWILSFCLSFKSLEKISQNLQSLSKALELFCIKPSNFAVKFSFEIFEIFSTETLLPGRTYFGTFFRFDSWELRRLKSHF
jgi:hypothetical protein